MVRIRPHLPPKERRCCHYNGFGLRCQMRVAHNFCHYRYCQRSGSKLSVGGGNVRRRISDGEVINPPPPQGSQAGGERCGQPRVSSGKGLNGGSSDGRRHEELADGSEDENLDTKAKAHVEEIHSEATEFMADDDEIPAEMYIAQKEGAKMRKGEHLEKQMN